MQLHLFIYFIISSLFVSGQNDSSPDQNLSAGSPKETIHNLCVSNQTTSTNPLQPRKRIAAVRMDKGHFFSGLIIIDGKQLLLEIKVWL
uniref:Uncharacterized protein n=1 Tax=Ditylenchus dipsaci TaxID=166011 RepID=A0A915DVN5_9BILA